MHDPNFDFEPDDVEQFEGLDLSPDEWADRYTDASGICFTDADPGL